MLYNRDPRFAHRLIALLNAEKEFTVGENVPYTVSDETDYTIPVHAERRGLHHVLIEIRQDLIADESGQWMGGALGALVAAGVSGVMRRAENRTELIGGSLLLFRDGRKMVDANFPTA